MRVTVGMSRRQQETIATSRSAAAMLVAVATTVVAAIFRVKSHDINTGQKNRSSS